MPHFTLDLRAPFRAGVVDPFLDGHAAGETPEPVRRLQRPRAPRRDGRLRRPARRGAPGHGPLRAGQRGRAAARGGRPGQGPDLHARGGGAGDARAAALPARRADQAARARAGRRGGAARRLQGRVAGPVLLGGHRQGRVPGPPRRARGPAGGDRRPRRTGARAAIAARTTSRSASARASASPRPSRCTCSPPTWAPTASWPARARRSPPARSPCGARRCTAPRARSNAVKLRYRSRALPCRVAAEHGRGRLELELGEPADGAAPGQAACLLRGDVVVGWGTIART